jgi:hypothetical protein
MRVMITTSVFQRHQNGYLGFLCIVRRRWPALYHTLERLSCKTDTELEELMQCNCLWRHKPTLLWNLLVKPSSVVYF